MAPTLAGAMLPYLACSAPAWPETCSSMARRSLRSRSRSPSSSATRNTTWSTAAWVPLRPSTRERRMGPSSETVVRSGWPPSP